MYLFAPFLFYKLSASAGLPLVPSVIVALLVCMAVGLINGFFTAVVGISSFVTTLGMLFALEGLALVISHGQPVETPGAAAHTTTVRSHTSSTAPDHAARTGQPHRHVRENLRRRHLLGADLGARDRDRAAGRADVHALGPAHGRGRLEQARRGEAGVQRQARDDPQLRPLRLAGGLVGIFEAVRARRSSRTPAAPTKSSSSRSPPRVIGGTLLAGGSGTVVGALIGALFLGVLKDGLILQGVNANYLLFYLGLAIISR